MELLQDISIFQPDLDSYESIWTEFMRQEHVYSVVATKNELVVGYGSIVIERKIRGGKMAHLEDIVVSADHRGYGVGTKLIDALYVIARNLGCYKIALHCQEHNVSFYEKCGYEIGGIAMKKFYF